MNLEQLIADNTAALHRLAEVIVHKWISADAEIKTTPEPLSATAEKPPVIEADPGLPPADEPLRYDQVAKAVTDLIKTKRQAGIDLLAQYKAKTLRDVPQEKWAEVKDAAEQLLTLEAA